MAEQSGGYGLVWLVVALMMVAGLAAYALVPGPGGPGNGGQAGPNQPPQAQITPPNRTATVGQTVELNAADSADPDGRIVSFEWTLGDGQSATGAIVQHEYTIVGAFEVTVTVTDDEGDTDTAVGHVWVNDFVTFAPGFVNWTAGQPAAVKTVGTVDVWPGATALTVVLNVSTVQPAGAKVNVTLLDTQGAEVAREARTIAGSNFVTQVTFTVREANLTAQGTWSVKLEVAPAQPAIQVFVSVAYGGTATVRYDPA